MAIRKVKSSAKMFVSDPQLLKHKVLTVMSRIADIVGSSLGPGGKVTLIESDYPGLPDKLTKDGVTIFRSLGSANSYEHLIIESTRDAAQRTASEAGDGTTTATILASAMVRHLYEFCENNPKFSPQKVARDMSNVVRKELVPLIQSKAIRIEHGVNEGLLKMVAKVSANGDDDMAEAVISAFELVGYGENSHVTIKELSGPYGYDVSLIEGFPLPIGYEESMGKFHQVFINDQANQRCYLENPMFLLFDGQINDLVSLGRILETVGQRYVNGESEMKNLVLFAHGYNENVLTNLSFNFSNPNTINVVPIVTPKAPFINAQTHFLTDLAAFTGAKVFGMKDSLAHATPEDLGKGMQYFESYRFRSTVVGDPEELNIQVRADELSTQKKAAESKEETIWLEERLGKLTNGIAKLTIYGGSNGELKEAHDRCEDAVCSVRSAIAKGALPGGCRTTIDLALYVQGSETIPDHVKDILVPSLIAPVTKLLENAGYSESELAEIVSKLTENPDMVYDVENQLFGKAEELGIFDSVSAVEESLKNATSIATVMGTIGGLVAYPRDEVVERDEARADMEFQRMADNPHAYTGEADDRI